MVTSLAPCSIEWPRSEQSIDGAALDAEQVEVLVHTETPDDHEANIFEHQEELESTEILY